MIVSAGRLLKTLITDGVTMQNGKMNNIFGEALEALTPVSPSIANA